MNHTIPGVAKSTPVLILPVTYEEAMSLYDLLRGVQYGRTSQSHAYAGLAERVAERLLDITDRFERHEEDVIASEIRNTGSKKPP